MANKLEDLTDRELQEHIYRELRQIRESNATTKNILIFFLIMSILAALISIF